MQSFPVAFSTKKNQHFFARCCQGARTLQCLHGMFLDILDHQKAQNYQEYRCVRDDYTVICPLRTGSHRFFAVEPKYVRRASVTLFTSILTISVRSNMIVHDTPEIT